jgi:hypothetical protein
LEFYKPKSRLEVQKKVTATPLVYKPCQMKFDPQVQMLKNIDKLNKMKIMKKDIVKV